jgi:hypothetical protein
MVPLVSEFQDQLSASRLDYNGDGGTEAPHNTAQPMFSLARGPSKRRVNTFSRPLIFLAVQQSTAYAITASQSKHYTIL